MSLHTSYSVAKPPFGMMFCISCIFFSAPLKSNAANNQTRVAIKILKMKREILVKIKLMEMMVVMVMTTVQNKKTKVIIIIVTIIIVIIVAILVKLVLA